MRLRNTLLAAATAAAVLTGCSKVGPVNPCEVNPTHAAADGTCEEADFEPCDSDPCDTDDLLGDRDNHRSTKPAVKPSAPKPRTTRR
jgi:hypothetical protein